MNNIHKYMHVPIRPQSNFYFLAVFITLLMYSCGGTKGTTVNGPQLINANIDLVNVNNDRVKVVVAPNIQINSDTLSYVMAKIIPGTYAIHDYGKYLDDFQAFDKQNNLLTATKTTTNTWLISNAKNLAYISYLVNDTFDTEVGFNPFDENSETIFSPAGTNILAGKNFVLNMSGFIGYFQGSKELPYSVTISHPETLIDASALNDQNPSNSLDVFNVDRYADLVDSPIMYSTPNLEKFDIDGMEVLLSVYSPKVNRISAASLTPDLKKMMVAQKNYLGPINTTSKYAVLCYITSEDEDDAKGIGALEHNFSTVAVFRETMGSQDLVDVISHEFFHTLTPLKVHSKEIHDFQFLHPKMSKHLWMYEGITEYFAQHFQVYEGLYTEDEFFAKMMEKINFSQGMDDKLSFTEMSKNVLEPKMKAQYPNVYLKGALMGMCLDIIIREKSGGKKSLLDVMGELAKIYGPKKPFDDSELIPKFTELTYPEVGDFIQKYIVEGGAIDYDAYLNRMGIERTTAQVVQPVIFIIGQTPYIMPNETRTEIVASIPEDNNEFYKAMGIKDGDVFLEFNGKTVDISKINDFLMMGYGIPEGTPVEIKVRRDGNELLLTGNAVNNYAEGEGFKFTDESKQALKDSWLHGS